MKVLKSQYHQLQCDADCQHISPNKTIKMILHKEKELAKGQQQIKMAVAPTCLQNKKNIVCFKENLAPTTNIEILFENIDKTLDKLNVVFEYVNMTSSWLTNIYKTYENDLWSKKPRLDIPANRKWIFCCGLCTNVYKSFYSMMTHLNLHLSIYPCVCKICSKKYTGRKAATRHLKKAHQLEKQQWNDFLIS